MAAFIRFDRAKVLAAELNIDGERFSPLAVPKVWRHLKPDRVGWPFRDCELLYNWTFDELELGFASLTIAVRREVCQQLVGVIDAGRYCPGEP